MIMLRQNKNQRLHEDKFIYDPASEIMIICFSFLFSDRTTKSVLYAMTCDNPVLFNLREVTQLVRTFHTVLVYRKHYI